jgi:Ca2+-dependent lipid-binding protein
VILVAQSYIAESGLLIFNLIEGTLATSDVRVEVLMDDMVFPSYSSAKVRSRHTQFGESESIL